MDAYKRLSPFIQEFIYQSGWTGLRAVQEAACNVVFNSSSNLLLSAGTASGKTEAAFLPALTLLTENPSASVGIIYVSPLKALINDQFTRLEELLSKAHIPICKWHGEASRSSKSKLLKKPEGILQITPESLEGLLMKQRKTCFRLFEDLRFVIIDEVHHFMSNERGLQLLCQLERIQRLAGCNPRRIGLSATLPDYPTAEEWLNTGSGRQCITPKITVPKRRLGIQMRSFTPDGSGKEMTRTEYIYRHTVGKKSIIFAKSRSEVEEIISSIRHMAKICGSRDVYHTHHGSISTSLRTEAEQEMKHSEMPIVIGATLSLELGIDVGTLDKVVQVGSPTSVTSLAQRVGRCGRRGQGAELVFVFEGHDSLIENLNDIDWEFLKAIAILELFLEGCWLEPVKPLRFPYSLLYHQTMTFMSTIGEATAKQLAQNVLGLAAFKHIPQDDYKLMLLHLIALEHLQRTDEGGLIIGRRAETLINRRGFYSVFESHDEFTVHADNRVIGTITEAQDIGDVFTLGGKVWEVIHSDERARIIYVEHTQKKPTSAQISSAPTDLSTELLLKIRHVLTADSRYVYMADDCVNRLKKIQEFAACRKLATQLTVPIAKNRYAIFPWAGTRELVKLRLALADEGINCTVSPNPSAPIFLEAVTTRDEQSLCTLVEGLLSKPIDKYKLKLPETVPLLGKFNRFLPEELLRKQYLEDMLS